MSKLKQKSEFNFDAGNKLINEHLYAPSVHCLYYSCFQLMKVIIKEFDGIEYNEFANKAREKAEAKNTQIEGSHEFVINAINKHVFNFDKNEYRNISSAIKKLKKLRVQSDYDNVEIITDEANEAKEKAIHIRTKLKKIFNQ